MNLLARVAHAARTAFTPRSTLREHTLVVGLGLLLGMGVRALLNPWLGDSFPLVFALPAVAVVSIVAGVGSALALAALSLVWIAVPWLPPNWPTYGPGQIAAAIVALGACALVGRLAQRTLPLLPAAAVEQYLAGVSRRGAMRALRSSMLLAVILPLALFAVLAWRSYNEAWQAARSRVEATVRVVAEHAGRVIETNKVITRQLLESLGDDDDAHVLAREQALHERLRRLAVDLPQVQSIWVWGADGRPLVSHRFYPAPRSINVSDREFFRWHKTHHGGFFVTPPLVARATGEAFFDITHRREDADGRFLGVVSVALHPSYFTGFYRRLVEAEPGLALSLLHDEGAVIARWPAPPQPQVARLPASSALLKALGEGEAAGWVEGRSSIDGRPRLARYRRIEGSPLVVVGALDNGAVLAAWARNTAALGSLTFGATIALVVVLWVALRRAQLEVTAVERLRAESEQRRRAEEALRQAQKLEALGRLTGGVAHDFNNLLTVINNNAFLLNHLLPRGAHDTQVGGILRAVKAGEKLTRQLLAFSRRQALRPEVVDLQDELPGMGDLLRATLGRRVDISIQVAPDAPLIEVDRGELELALLNLALNARDAMAEVADRQPRFALIGRRAGHDELARLLPARERDRAAGFAVISVSDTGKGIDAAITDRVFEPFFTTKGPGEGTGLGLSQVYGFCVQAGGIARVDSTPGVGTTVSLVLPATLRQRRAEDEIEAIAPTALAAHVLLVEDNEEVAATTCELLRSFGAQVTHLADARSAQQRIEAKSDDFDIVLSDVVMPGGMSGLELARALRTSHPELPVVLITGYTAEIHQALAAGFSVLSKPCAPTDLSAALSRALQPHAGATATAPH